MASTAEAEQGGLARAAISNLMVRLHREYAGRGPVKTRTYMHDDLIACVLEDALTPVEQTLAVEGQTETVEDVRSQLQEAMRRDMVHGVEKISGRRVRVFLSANQVNPNVAVETFLLEQPESWESEPRAQETEAPTSRGSRVEVSEGHPTTSAIGGPSPRPEPSYRSEPDLDNVRVG